PDVCDYMGVTPSCKVLAVTALYGEVSPAGGRVGIAGGYGEVLTVVPVWAVGKEGGELLPAVRPKDVDAEMDAIAHSSAELLFDCDGIARLGNRLPPAHPGA